MGGSGCFRCLRGAVLLAAVAVLLSIFVWLPASFGQTSSAIWLATHTTVYRVDTAANRITASLPLPREAEGVAVDAALGGVWVLAHKRLYRFDAATTGLVAEYDLKRLSSKLEDPERLLLNPYDGSLWVAGEKSLLHLDSLGRPLIEWRASEEITALTLALDESLWLTTKKELLQLSASGSVLARVSLASLLHEPRAISIDSLGGIVWLADSKTLLKLNLKDLSQPPIIVYQAKDETKGEDRDEDGHGHGHLAQLAIDSLSGRLWATSKTEIRSFDRTGTLLATTALPSDLKETEVLLYDSGSQSLWLGTKKALARLSDSGAVVARLDINSELEAAAAAPFQLAPQLSLLAPPDGLLTNNPRPTIRLGLSALCQDTSCAPGEGYFNSLSLNATLNGSPVGSLFSLSDVEAAYMPAERLPDGENLFSAQATDAFAHLSNTVRVKFTIDTIPPKFLSLTPADGSVVNTQPVTLGGSLDDATATVILENMALLGASVVDGNPQQFSFKVPLQDGPNTFVLIARDPAGNEAKTTLNLTYSPVSVNVTNIAQGATVNTDRLLVMGTFRGPPNTGVTVNGIVAETYGDKFYVNNLSLKLGENVITVTATTPERITSSQSFTVLCTDVAKAHVERTILDGINLIDTMPGVGRFGSPTKVALGGDGSLYVADPLKRYIFRIAQNGVISIAAGSGANYFYGDGGLAVNAGLQNPSGVALGSDGSIYIADTGSYRIRRVDPGGIITTVAGGGYSWFSGDGGPATDASFVNPVGIAVAPDGSFYIADGNRVRRVGTDGIINSVAGGSGLPNCWDDGIPAKQSCLSAVNDVVLAPDGSLYILERNRVRRVDLNGVITSVAGNAWNYGFSGDGGPAVNALFNFPLGIGISPSGTLFIADSRNNRIRRVTSDGVITTVAGIGAPGFAGDGGSAEQAKLNNPSGVAINSGGTVYIADKANAVIRRVQSLHTTGNTAPLTVAFKVTNNTGNAIQKIEVDFDGNGGVDFTTVNPDAPIYYAYQNPGAYLAKFTITDSQNNVYAHTYAVVLHDPQQLDQQFKSIWDGMNGALAKNDITTAGKYLNESAKKRYLPVMQALAPHMAEITASFSAPSRVSLSENIGEYAVTRDYNGKKRLYLIYFLRDVDGVWRLDGM